MKSLMSRTIAKSQAAEPRQREVLPSTPRGCPAQMKPPASSTRRSIGAVKKLASEATRLAELRQRMRSSARPGQSGGQKIPAETAAARTRVREIGSVRSRQDHAGLKHTGR